MVLKIRTDVKIIDFEQDDIAYRARYIVDGKEMTSIVRSMNDKCYIQQQTNRFERWRYNFTEEENHRFKEFLDKSKIENKKEQYSKDIQAKKDMLEKQVKDIALNYSHSPEQLAELAAFEAKFYNYSFRNTLLILSQNRGASFVGSFAKFKELGKEIAVKNNEFDENGNVPYFGVKSGEKGMKILVPVKVTLLKVDNEWLQISKATAAQKQAAKAGKIETKEITAFNIGTVFDISQTHIPSKYYPEIYSMGYSSEEHAKIFEGLKTYIENELGCPVKEEIDNTITLRGICYTNVGKGIELNTKLEDTQRLSTLAHELGHFLMHREQNSKPSAQCEVEADIYNIMLNSHFGIETNDVRKGHLADSYRAYKEIISNSDSEKEFDDLNKIFSNAAKAFKETVEDIDRYVEQYVKKEKSFAEQVDESLNGTLSPYTTIKVCDTPQILLDVGCSQLPMLYTQRHLKNALKSNSEKEHFHNLSVEQIKKLPDLLQAPVMLYDSLSRNDSIVAVTSEFDKNDNPIIVSIKPNGKGRYQLETIESNFITSVHGREHFVNQIQKTVEQDKMLFCDKQKSQEMFERWGLQLSELTKSLDFNIIIHQSRNIVNSKTKENREISTKNKSYDTAKVKTSEMYETTDGDLLEVTKSGKHSDVAKNIHDGSYSVLEEPYINGNSIEYRNKKDFDNEKQAKEYQAALENGLSNKFLSSERKLSENKNQSYDSIGRTIDEELQSSKVAPKRYNIIGAVDKLTSEFPAEEIKACAALSVLCRKDAIANMNVISWARDHALKNNIDISELKPENSPCKCHINLLSAFATKLETQAPVQRKILHGEPINKKNNGMKI